MPELIQSLLTMPVELIPFMVIAGILVIVLKMVKDDNKES